LGHTFEELLKAIITCSPDGYVSCDEFGKIVFINEVIEKITGWSAKELISQEASKLYSLPESLALAANEDGKIKPQAAILFRRDGKKLTLKARQIEIKKADNNKSGNLFGGYLTIFHTENPVSSNLARVQVAFVSTVSHELRTP
jgi:PAS domain S-box-containing protein